MAHRSIRALLPIAPVTWGVSEVPSWGLQLPPSRALAEMRSLGLGATEFGPAGFLLQDPSERPAPLARHQSGGLSYSQAVFRGCTCRWEQAQRMSAPSSRYWKPSSTGRFCVFEHEIASSEKSLGLIPPTPSAQQGIEFITEVMVAA